MQILAPLEHPRIIYGLHTTKKIYLIFIYKSGFGGIANKGNSIIFASASFLLISSKIMLNISTFNKSDEKILHTGLNELNGPV